MSEISYKMTVNEYKYGKSSDIIPQKEAFVNANTPKGD